MFGCSAVRLARHRREVGGRWFESSLPDKKKEDIRYPLFRIDPNLSHDETTPHLFLRADRHRAIRL